MTLSGLLSRALVDLPPLEVVISDLCSTNLIQSSTALIKFCVDLPLLDVVISTMCSSDLILSYVLQ